MLTKEKVVKAMQTLPTKFSAEELLQHLLLLEGKSLYAVSQDDQEIVAEVEMDTATEDFKEWSSLA